MKAVRVCQYCNFMFTEVEGKIFSNHVRWCHERPSKDKFSSVPRMVETKERNIRARHGPVTEFLVPCAREGCTHKAKVREREKLHPRKAQYFCSRSCANSRGPRNEDFKEKVSDKLKGRKISERRYAACKHCCREYEITVSQKKLFCNSKCRSLHHSQITPPLRRYRQLAAFRFNLSDYPEEFDFSLIEAHGWYKPANRGNNLSGVSRDHIVSVKFGYDNQIDPEVISHPANCQLIQHNDNVSKGKRSSLSISQLHQRILEWNKKYPLIPR